MHACMCADTHRAHVRVHTQATGYLLIEQHMQEKTKVIKTSLGCVWRKLIGFVVDFQGTHTHTHISIFAGTFIKLIHFPGPYPNYPN